MSDLASFLLNMNHTFEKLTELESFALPKVKYDRAGLLAIERHIAERYEPEPFVYDGLFAVYAHFFGQTITNTVPGAVWVDCEPEKRPRGLCIRIPMPSGGEHTKALFFPWNAIREYWPTRKPSLVSMLDVLQRVTDPNFDLQAFYAGDKMYADGTGFQADDMDFVLNEQREAFFKNIKDKL